MANVKQPPPKEARDQPKQTAEWMRQVHQRLLDVGDDYVPKATTLTATSPIRIDGGASADLSANRTLSHADSGVTAAAYTNASVTVDAKGHVTAASSGAAAATYRDLSSFRDTGGGTLGAVHWYTANAATAAQLNALTALTANRIYAIPFIAPARGGTLDRIAIRVDTAVAASVVRLGIYENNNDDTTIYPGALLLDAGTVTSASTGVKTITISQALTASKLYWLVCTSGHGPTIYRVPLDECTHILGQDGTFNGANNTHIRATFTLAALPSTFTNAAITSPALSVADCPAIAVRFSA